MTRPPRPRFKAKTPEGQVKASIRQFIRACAPGCRLWAIIGGPLQEAGIADYLGLYKPPGEGTKAIPLAVEVKAPGGGLSEAQKIFKAEWEAHGGLFVLAYGPEDVAKALGIRGLLF